MYKILIFSKFYNWILPRKNKILCIVKREETIQIIVNHYIYTWERGLIILNDEFVLKLSWSIFSFAQPFIPYYSPVFAITR